MFTRLKRTLLLVSFLLVIGPLWSYIGQADVTGSFGLDFSFSPVQCQDLEPVHGIVGFPDQPCEKTFYKVEVGAVATINVSLGGLTLGLHTHIGATGFEDIILTFTTTLGALDITDTFVFAQPYGVVLAVPTCYEDTPGSGVCLTLFVKKRVEISIPDICAFLGISSCRGPKLKNLAIFEDVNFPNPSSSSGGRIYTAQSQSFGFGDLLTIEGQTIGGITITGQASLCVAQGSNVIKQHAFSSSVNPDCVGGGAVVKPLLFFDFERLSIGGLALTPTVITNGTVTCTAVSGCDFTNGFTFSDLPIFSTLSTSLSFDLLPGPLTFSGASANASNGPLTLSFGFSPALQLSAISGAANFTINPDTNPASLFISLGIVPIDNDGDGKFNEDPIGDANGDGCPGVCGKDDDSDGQIDEGDVADDDEDGKPDGEDPVDGSPGASVTLSLNRSGINLSAAAAFSGTGGKLTFSNLTLAVSTQAGFVAARATATFSASGLTGAELSASVNFDS